MVDRLAGMFAFALSERDSGRTVLARDRLGIKPLYLADVDGGLRFASTIPALVAGGGIDTAVDPVGLHHYLTFHAVVPAPRTVLAGVRKLPPASLLVVEPDGQRREREYWNPWTAPAPGAAPASPDATAADWREAIEAALRLAVRRRLVADVPVGVLLSGGLDSSLIVALLAEEGQSGLATFSIPFLLPLLAGCAQGTLGVSPSTVISTVILAGALFGAYVDPDGQKTADVEADT